MLPLASLLESLDEPEAARRAFEAGYRSLLDRGGDPRLNLGLIGKMILYPGRSATLDPSTDRGRELMERHYRLGPYAESADLAWTAYANALERAGRSEDAARWRTRATEAAHTSIFLLPRRVTLLSDMILLAIFAALTSACLFIVMLHLRYRPQRRADAQANPGRSLFARILLLFSFQHWSLAQRIAFLTIALVAWVGTGIETGILAGIGRVAATPLNMAMGSLAGPVPRDYLERSVPASPERDLLLAFSNQRSGRPDRAEPLYRSLPQFAESWNNLGVILQAKGNASEAQQAFEKALQLDPNLGEAAVNLGRPPVGYWAEQYARYFPGRPMLASPSPQRVSTALFGATLRQICFRGLAGPLAGGTSIGNVFMLSGTGSADAPAGDLFMAVLAAVSLLAVAVLFIPSRAVTEAPPRAFLAAEVLFPGLAAAWNILAGLALTLWTYLALQLILIFQIGTPYIITGIAQPSLDRSYGIASGDPGALLASLGPGKAWTHLAPLALFLLNLAVVMLTRKKPAQEGN
jgi:tetratricopeptide (TPR) repeat protein